MKALVTFHFDIDKNGRVDNARVQGQSYGDMDYNTLKTVTAQILVELPQDPIEMPDPEAEVVSVSEEP